MTRIEQIVAALLGLLLLCFLTLSRLYPYHDPDPTIVKHYRAGLMEHVAAKRGLTRAEGIDGLAAVNDCSWIGGVIDLSIDGESMESFQVVDCSAPQDVERHRAEGLIAEVDWPTAVRHGFAWDGGFYQGAGHADAVMGRYYTAQQWAERQQ